MYGFLPGPYCSLRSASLNVKQLLMAEPQSNTSQASYKTGKREETELQSSSRTVVSCKIDSEPVSGMTPALLTC